MNKLKNNNKYYNFLSDNYPVIIGVFIRVVLFIIFSTNKFLFPDEMSFLYNCKTITENGTDALGQIYPIYFNTWLVGGHSPLPIYITSLFVKLFGVNFFALKLPSLLLGCTTFIVFSKLIKLFIEDKEKCKTIILLDALCMGSINMSVFMLDCWWMNYFITFGLYAFFLGIKNNKKALIYLSTLFFTLGFYCYIASVFIIPFLLIGIYIFQLKKKTITFKTALLNGIEAIIIAVPFIIFGLVASGIIPAFKILNITYPDMSLYTRNSYVGLSLSGIIDGFTSLIYNFSSIFTLYGVGIDLGIIAIEFIVLLLTNKIKPKFKKDLKKEVYIPFLIPAFIFILFTSTDWSYRIAAFLTLVTVPIFCVLADVLNTKLGKKVILGTVSAALILGVISSCFLLSNSNFYAFTNYIEENNINVDVYTNIEETDEKEETNNYEQAWWSYKFRIEIPDNYINFREEQTERYYGENTVQISEKILITKKLEDIRDKNYLFTSQQDNYKGRKLIKIYHNYGAHLTRWYLYGPVS